MAVTIEAELNKIWDSLEGSNKIRASLFNLIFFTKKSDRSAYIKSIAQKVIEKFPSRVILITADTDSKEQYLETHVSVRQISEEGAVCDFIEIEVGGMDEERVPFVLLPNLIPDLPIYVIWPEDPDIPSALFSMLQQVATRMIFDSEASSNLPQFANTLIQLEKHFDIADLNWARTENWRKLITSTFYTNQSLAHLKNCSQIDIFYNAQQPPFPSQTDVQALFLQGWIGSQLKWKLENITCEKEKVTLQYQRENGNVNVNLYPELHPHLNGGAIVSVDLHTEDQCHFSFGRDLESPHQVHMRFSTLDQCDIPLQYLFPKDETGQSLVREICHKGTSHHYSQLLQQIQTYKE